MKCIFCRENSNASKSIEHIIPESLGNVDHILPKGVVCDKCNNYFAIKIEKQLLEQDYFRSLRHTNNITNKKGRDIAGKGIIVHPQGGIVDIYKSDDGMIMDVNNPDIVNLIETSQVNKFYVPIYFEPQSNNIILSRFLCKVALEALTLKLLNVEGWEEEIYKVELNPIRTYARYGNEKIKFWNYTQRKLNKEEVYFYDETLSRSFEILHQYWFNYTDEKELFFYLTIMDIEYGINVGGPEN